MKEIFALVPINERKELRWYKIIAFTATRKEMEQKINSDYWGTKGLMAKGSKFDFEDYMADKKILKFTYEIVD